MNRNINYSWFGNIVLLLYADNASLEETSVGDLKWGIHCFKYIHLTQLPWYVFWRFQIILCRRNDSFMVHAWHNNALFDEICSWWIIFLRWKAAHVTSQIRLLIFIQTSFERLHCSSAWSNWIAELHANVMMHSDVLCPLLTYAKMTVFYQPCAPCCLRAASDALCSSIGYPVMALWVHR